ncbi:metal ABC transporter substrate-binding protein [Lentisphaera marina]|uniref:metal ABC transporter substrate-binding protein n=1 Tax=Lentisphaera marina TaxID=1111041 RepID=UPI0023671178|nr:metal ABC transporter substrate-binding protein [Lentisphaera marina]MDD7984757.1 metal ABC transporter substrate-binding protein [Lentisphaera marina]
MKYFVCLFFLVTTQVFAKGEVKVEVSIPPLKGLVNTIGGKWVTVKSLMSDSVDPHIFSVSPGQISQIKKADLMMVVGTMDFEKKLIKLRTDTINLGSDFVEENEHLWLDLSFLRSAAKSISKAIISKNKSAKSDVEKNLDSYLKKLSECEAFIIEKRAKITQPMFYSYHGVFYYLAKEYDLQEVYIQVNQKTPTPRELLTIINKAKKDKVKVIFMQAQFNDRPAKMIASRTGAKIIKINPLQEDTLALLRLAIESL